MTKMMALIAPTVLDGGRAVFSHRRSISL